MISSANLRRFHDIAIENVHGYWNVSSYVCSCFWGVNELSFDLQLPIIRQKQNFQ